VFSAAERSLSKAQLDFPFTLTYLFVGDGTEAAIASHSGIERGTSYSPHVIEIAHPGATWPLTELIEQAVPLSLRTVSEVILRLEGSAINDDGTVTPANPRFVPAARAHVRPLHGEPPL